MANYTHTVHRVSQCRWELQLPNNATEVDKAVSAAAREWKNHNDPFG